MLNLLQLSGRLCFDVALHQEILKKVDYNIESNCPV